MNPNQIERAEGNRIQREYFNKFNVNFAAISQMKVKDVLKIHNKIKEAEEK